MTARRLLDWQRPSDDQTRYVASLCERCRVSPAMLDTYCAETFGYAYAELAKGECSTLIDTLKGWKSPPPELARLAGQIDLFAL